MLNQWREHFQQHSSNALAFDVFGRYMTHEYYCPILQRYMVVQNIDKHRGLEFSDARKKKKKKK